MNLHSDRAAFELIIDEVASSSGVRRDVLEKDYYVTLIFKRRIAHLLPINMGIIYFIFISIRRFMIC